MNTKIMYNENHHIGMLLLSNKYEAVYKFHEKMKCWNPEEPCNICEESWFDQDNLPNEDICARCNRERNKNKHLILPSLFNF